ncbi:MAG: helix-turn-helix transcriptional regulator [Deltaproteobacteria bacterium]|nr:helix-turn-helix transcriptional regulator [Deltaproteobacteria bacterium]
MPRRKKDKPMGQRLKEIRGEKGFSIEHVSNETGFSVEYISDIEEGKLRPPVATILRLSRALEIDSGILLKKDEDEANKKRAEGFKERTESYSYEVLTPEAAYKHLKAFKVFIDPVSDHKSVSYQHEGEEFIYVLQGRVEVTVGENKTVLEPGDSLHFNSSIVHKLKNLSSERAETIVVLYTP